MLVGTMNKTNIIDIHSKGEYPSYALSNFAEYEFYIDDVKCLSMEGFLQSLKFKTVKKQKQVCLLSGKVAKNSTRHTIAQLRWRITHNLYWQGKRINRFSDEYQMLLDKAYKSLAENHGFHKALMDSSPYTFAHSIGKTDNRKTVLKKIRCLNRTTDIRTYEKFSALAEFLGTSKSALAIRMKQLNLLDKEYLDNPFAILDI
jgi:hypothetical protein